MSIKVVLGIILTILGLGSGVWSWFLMGLSGPFPVLGLVLFFIGLYLIASGLRKPKVSTGDVVKAGLGLLVGYAAGKIIYDKIQEYFTEQQRSGKLTLDQIIEIERKIDELYLEGKLPADKYQRSKLLIAQLKQRHGAA
jgi:hypothetical protein